MLRDVGHLLVEPNHDMAGLCLNDHHEKVGAHWLARFFGPDVTEPARRHVQGIRYLCAVQKDYVSGLSSSSLVELAARG